MLFTYDPEADALGIELIPGGKSARTQQVAPDVNLDWDAKGRLMMVEILNASAHYPKAQLAGLDDGADWLTLAEAEEAGQAEGGPKANTLRVLLHTGKIEGKKRGREWTIARHVLTSYLENRSAAGRPGRRPRAKKAAAKK